MTPNTKSERTNLNSLFVFSVWAIIYIPRTDINSILTPSLGKTIQTIILFMWMITHKSVKLSI